MVYTVYQSTMVLQSETSQYLHFLSDAFSLHCIEGVHFIIPWELNMWPWNENTDVFMQRRDLQFVFNVPQGWNETADTLSEGLIEHLSTVILIHIHHYF